MKVFKNNIYIFFLFCLLILIAALKGIPGNPTSDSLLKSNWRDNGPFELSPERGRFALTYSIIEDKSVHFSIQIARFIIPDLGYKNRKYVSLFAPLVSFISIPGYLIGKYLGAAQIGVFATSTLFALFNAILIYLIAKKFGTGKLSALIASSVFLFATPAFSYATTIYEHHISTFLILLAFYILIVSKNFWSLAIIWFLCAVSIPVDYPNLFLMAPIGIYALGRVISLSYVKEHIHFSIKTTGVISLITILIPLTFFLWFNWKSYGDPLQFSGTVRGVTAIDVNGNPMSANTADPQNVAQFLNLDNYKRSVVGFFQSRNMLNGLYTQLLSPDRGIIYFTPIILLGIIGMVILYKRRNRYLPILLGIIGADILLYSMWGDPWGGWAFGSRYLIPSYAILAIFIAVFLSKFRKYLLILIIFFVVLAYSIFVNTAGALTSNANPPQVEVLALEKISGSVLKFSFDRNLDLLDKNSSKSFVFQTYLNKLLTARQFFYIIFLSITLVSLGNLLYLYLDKDKNNEH